MIIDENEFREFAVMVGVDTADEAPTCLHVFDEEACAEELAQHVPGAWIAQRRVITHEWVRVH